MLNFNINKTFYRLRSTFNTMTHPPLPCLSYPTGAWVPLETGNRAWKAPGTQGTCLPRTRQNPITFTNSSQHLWWSRNRMQRNTRTKTTIPTKQPYNSLFLLVCPLTVTNVGFRDLMPLWHLDGISPYAFSSWKIYLHRQNQQTRISTWRTSSLQFLPSLPSGKLEEKKIGATGKTTSSLKVGCTIFTVN